MFGNKQARKAQTIDSLIGATTRIEGAVRFQGGLRIDGEVIGDVVAIDGAESMLVISENGKIQGAVNAEHVVVNGHIHGPVLATNLIELQPNARIKGDVRYRALEMHQGATVEGMLLPDVDSNKPALKLAANTGS